MKTGKRISSETEIESEYFRGRQFMRILEWGGVE